MKTHKLKCVGPVIGDHGKLDCHIPYECENCGLKLMDYYHKEPWPTTECKGLLTNIKNKIKKNP